MVAANLERELAEQAVWAVRPDGKIYRGAEAINLISDTLTGSQYFRRLYNLPLIGTVQDAMYAIIVRNRSRLPGTTPALEQLDRWQPQL